jgi:hypothetical protein
MIISVLALAAAAAPPLPKEDIQEVLASWEAAQMYCERGNTKACAEQKSYAAKMRSRFGLCPAKSGERGDLVVCKTGKKADFSFD